MYTNKLRFLSLCASYANILLEF